MKRKKSAVKTKICEAVLDLLGKKSIAEIRICEVTEKANVARASFYRNFDSFDEVLDYIAEDYLISFNEHIKPMFIAGNYEAWYGVVHDVLANIYEKRHNFTDILSDNLRIIFYKMEVLNRNLYSKKLEDSPYINYEHVAKISAFYTVCMSWIQRGAKESIEDMTIFMLDKVLMINKING